MGKKSRREGKVKRKPVPFVERPFEGLPAEVELVAMRDILPSATITARTTAEHGGREITFATLLPNVWAALHRDDGSVLVALQTHESSGDSSRSLAAALLQALEIDAGDAVQTLGILEPGPRLQDVLDPETFGELKLYEDFDFWVSPAAERTAELDQALQETGSQVVPSAPVEGLRGAFWCRMNREFVRWVREDDPERVLDGLARLHARRENTFDVPGGPARFVGAFRAAGLIVPVWELPDETTAESLAEPMAAFGQALDEAVATEGSLDADERRARAGLVSRQVSL